ncbi:hypothetical protein EUGRSUZ_F01935 [Eucalyptus grandis]|uniref:Protein kinase domain-containing protein n=2 Tax=Eucalyptus grandis TaxID=71139 RepID=A0A059BQW6_EUCGR|nr:hypothetical protein EUGRSUZ_F01935 [Eucalyptus grandis]
MYLGLIPGSMGMASIDKDSPRKNYTSVYNFSSCGSAFLVDQDSFNVSKYELPVPNDMLVKKYSNVVLDWVVERDLTCKEAQSNRSSYACGANSFCSDFRNGQGYRCLCDAGYTGNPYTSPLSPGCQDIDECKNPRRYPCHGYCKNTPGNYTCETNSFITLFCVVVIVSITLSVVVSGLVFFICKRRAKERYVRQNGGEILKHQRVKIFTKAQLAKATNHYDTSNKLNEGGFASIYKGRIDGDVLFTVKKPRDVLVNKSKDMNKDLSLSTHDEFLHEISIISQVNHKNLVKLLGICLETNVPLLFYEFIPNGTLYHHIHDKRSTLLTEEMPTQCTKYGEKINAVQFFISPMENQTLIHMTKFEASNEGELQEIEAVGSLARRCLNFNGVKRPTMREVAEQLTRINKNLWADRQDDEETQSVLDETGCDSLRTSIGEMNKLNRLLFYYLTSKQPVLVPVSDSCFLT